MNLHKKADKKVSHRIKKKKDNIYDNDRSAGQETGVQISSSHRSASSSVASLLWGRTGLLHCADAGDRLLEEEEEEEQKFFWDLVREAPSSDMSSLAVAFRMLL